MYWVRLFAKLAVVGTLSMATTGAGIAAVVAGVGSTDLGATVASVRAGSAGAGRVFVGGGLRGGK